MLKRVLLLTSAINFPTGLFAVFFPSVFNQLVYGQGVEMDQMGTATHTMFWLYVAAFGAFYFLGARDEGLRAGVLLMGGTGKMIAAGVWAALVLGGNHSVFLAPPIIFDGTLGVYFVWSFVRGQRQR